MSRSFENEYRNMIVEDVPDLWSRIEGNLKAKNIPLEEEKPEQTNRPKGKSKKITKIYTKKFVVAACLCIVIVVGGAATILDKHAGKHKNFATADMEIATAPEMNASLYDNSDRNSNEGSIGEKYSEASTEVIEDGTTDVGEDVMNSQQAKSTLGQKSEENSPESGAETLESETVNYQAVVKIISIENTGEEILYYGEVLPSVYSIFEPGQTITFCIGDRDMVEPEVGRSYRVRVESLTEETGTEIIYMLKELEQEAK